MNRVRLLLVVLLGGFCWLSSSAPAAAHAFLVSSSPADGSRLERAPGEIRLEFDEPIELARDAVKVLSAQGEQADNGRPEVHGATITIRLRPELPNGTYVAAWRLLSADGHVVGGAIQFGVGVDPTGGQVITDSAGGSLATAAGTARGLVYAGLVACAGVFVASRWLWPWASRRRPRCTASSRPDSTLRTQLLIGAGWSGCVIGLAAQLLLLGPRAENTGWAGVARLAGLGTALTGEIGRLQLAGLLLLLVLAPLLARPPSKRTGNWPALAAMAALLVCVAMTGHNSVGAQHWLATMSAVLHLAAMTVWLGGVLLLVVVVLPRLRAMPRVPTHYLDPWSRTAFGCVALLILSGEYLGWRQLEPLQSLWSTRYGLILLLKVTVVALVLLAAWQARRRVTRQGVPSAGMLRAELALTGVVLVVTTVLVAQPPARTVYGPPYAASASLGAGTVQLAVDTTRRGPAVITAQLSDHRASALTATLASADAGVGTLKVRMDADPATAGLWRSQGAVIPAPGHWTLTLKPAQGAATATFTYPVW